MLLFTIRTFSLGLLVLSFCVNVFAKSKLNPDAVDFTLKFNDNYRHDQYIQKSSAVPVGLGLGLGLGHGHGDDHGSPQESLTSTRTNLIVNDGVDTFALASYYGSHMVLQSAPRRAQVWGYAPKSEMGKSVMITLQSKDQQQSYYANFSAPVVWSNEVNSAVWQIQMTPVNAGGPYLFQAQLSNYNPLQMDDVMFGDVWLCSGQSNMEFPVAHMFNATEELAHAHLFTKVRIFNVAMITSEKPLYDLPGISLNWTLPTNDTVNQFSAVCWLFGRYTNMLTGRPQGMVETCWGGTPVEAWSSPEALRQCGIKPSTSAPQSDPYWPAAPPTNGSVLWNAMINPLLPMTINGALWYQGEANVGAPNTYNCTFPMMISDWRKKFHSASNGQTSPLFPFGFVQLAPSDDRGWNLTEGTTDIRWHQTADVGYVPNNKMTNVFMAVTMDLPDPNSPYSGIHPRDKITVGERLSLAGWAVAYGKQGITYQGPFPTTITYNGTTINVAYNMDIQTRVNDGFEVCCNPMGCAMSDKSWTPAPMKTSTTSKVTLSVDSCHKDGVSGMRYAWRENPCQYKKCAVYSSVNNLPAPPFIHWTFH